MADAKALFRQATQKQKRIEHPLAKYSTTGQLTCVLCTTPVKSDALWHTHLLSKRHKDAVQGAEDKRRKDAMKRASAEQQHQQDAKRQKGLVGGDSDNDDSDTNNEAPAKPKATTTTTTTTTATTTGKSSGRDMASKLPEGFFDDARKEIKVRKVDPRDALEDEFAKFQKELAVETEAADVLLEEDAADDMIGRAVEEQIEQQAHEDRFAQLKDRFEKSKQITNETKTTTTTTTTNNNSDINDDDDNDDNGGEEDDEDIDAMFGWRAKAI